MIDAAFGSYAVIIMRRTRLKKNVLAMTNKSGYSAFLGRNFFIIS